MVPEGWKLTNFDKVGIRVIDGDRGKHYPKSGDFYTSGHCVFLSAKNVTKRGFDFSEVQFISEEKDKQLRKGTVKPGNIVLTTRGTLGQFARFDRQVPFKRLRINSGMVVLENNEENISGEFLFAVCNSPAIKRQIERAAFGSAQPQLTVGIIKGLKTYLPPLPEQKKIAKILSTWDKAIVTTEQLLANSQQQKKALMQQLLTGKKRFPGFKEEWKFKRIRDVATRIQRQTDGEEHPILTISSLSGFVRQDEKFSRYMAGESVKKYILLKKGEFAYNKGNSKTYEFGCIFDLQEYESGLVPHVYVCFSLKEGLSHRYFKYLFEADYLKPQLGRLVNTGVRNNGLLNIRPAEFLNTKVMVPTFDEQEKIADLLHASTAEIVTLQQKLDRLKEEKKALMQQLLTGKRRVKVDKEVAECQ